MMKFFTTAASMLMVAGAVMSAQAADYITAPMNVTPANGTVMGGLGDIDIQWQGVDLEVESTDTSVRNHIDLSFVNVVLNGEENTAWESYMDAGLYVHHIEYSDEQNGTENVIDGGYVLTLYLGTMSYFWRGEVNITIKEGAVTSTTGEINPEINLTYYMMNTTEWNQISFEPATKAEFIEGEGEVTVSWDMEAEISFNPNCKQPIQAVSLDEEGGPDQKYNLQEFSTITDNKLVVSFTTLPAASYFLNIPEGAILLGEDTINLESTEFEFKILGDNAGDDNPGDDNGDDEGDEGDDGGVSSIYDDQNTVKSVFNLNGVKVNPEALNPGIYVINGKKVIIK